MFRADTNMYASAGLAPVAEAVTVGVVPAGAERVKPAGAGEVAVVVEVVVVVYVGRVVVDVVRAKLTGAVAVVSFAARKQMS